MKIQIDIPIESVSCFSEQAKQEFQLQAQKIANDLADEAMRVETYKRSLSKVKQVTPDMVEIAAEKFLKQYVIEKKAPLKIFTEIISIVSTSLTSIFFTIAFSNLTNHLVILVLAIIFFAIAITTSVISILNKI